MTITELPVTDIIPGDNDRTEAGQGFDEHAMAELRKSIEAIGLLEPVIVRPTSDGRYELVAGERRWRAHRDLGHSTIPSIVRDFNDRDAAIAMMAENLARVDLDPVDEGNAYRNALEQHGLTIAELAALTGKQPGLIRSRIALTGLVDEARHLIRTKALWVTNARDLVGLDPDRQRVACRVWVQTPDLTIEGWNTMIARLREAQNAENQGSFDLLVEDMTATARTASERRAPARKLVELLRATLGHDLPSDLAGEITEAIAGWDRFHARTQGATT